MTNVELVVLNMSVKCFWPTKTLIFPWNRFDTLNIKKQIISISLTYIVFSYFVWGFLNLIVIILKWPASQVRKNTSVYYGSSFFMFEKHQLLDPHILKYSVFKAFRRLYFPLNKYFLPWQFTFISYLVSYFILSYC